MVRTPIGLARRAPARDVRVLECSAAVDVLEVIIRAYWMLDALSTGRTADQRKLEVAKLRSMLLLGHTVATSGTLVKTGLVFGMNPAALNYPQLLAMVPATIAWLKESIAREQRIGSALDAEWLALIAEDNRVNDQSATCRAH